MPKKRIKLDEQSKELIVITASELIPMLAKKKKLSYVKQFAFEHYNDKNKEHFQVQVLVTRKEHDFLEFLQIEEMQEYGYPE